MSETPELDKMIAVKEQSRVIGDFLDWLGRSPFVICECDGDDNCPDCGNDLCLTRKTKEQLLADFFGIDLNKCEQECQQILDDLRNENIN